MSDYEEITKFAGGKVKRVTVHSSYNGTTGIDLEFENGKTLSVSEVYIDGYGWSGLNVSVT